MIVDRYSGDPKILITANGTTLDYEGGQPEMDQGVENQAMLALFIDSDWCGNLVLPFDNQIGSKFEAAAKGPALTLSGLNDIQNLAEIALKSDVFPSKSVSVTNPTSDRVKLVATLGPGLAPLELQRFGQNWQNQASNPAYKRSAG